MRRLRPLWAASLVVTFGLAACSRSEGPSIVDSDLPDVAATFEGRSGELVGTIEIDGRRADIEGRFSGSELTRASRGWVRGSVPFDPPVPLELSWADQRVVSERASGLADLGPWPLLLVSGNVFGEGVVETPMSFLADAIEPLFPPAFLSRLATKNPTESRHEGASAVLTFDYSTPLLGSAESTIALWIGPGATLERVVMTTNVAGNTAVLDYAVTLDDDAVVVSLPETTVPTVPSLAPTGEYAEVRAGSEPNLEWRLLRAPSRDGIDCWRVESTPPITIDEPNSGADARCLAGPDENDDLVDQVVFVLSSVESSDAGILVVQLPSETVSASLGFFGGAIMTVSIADDLAIWTGAANENPVYLELELAGSVTLACGMGALSDASELSDPQLADVRLGLPWVCSRS